MILQHEAEVEPTLTRERADIRVDGQALWGELAYGENTPSFSAVIMNPHPYMGGSARNLLVAALADGVAAAGGASLRFDYRGVGESDGGKIDVIASMNEFWKTGRAPEDAGMHDDGAAAIEWMRRACPAPMVLIGYSFGAHVAAHTVPTDAAALVLVSPTLTRHEFDLSSPAMSWAASDLPVLAVYSDNDFATPAAVVERWLNAMERRPAAHCIAGGQHFFRGHEKTIADITTDFVFSSLRALRRQAI